MIPVLMQLLGMVGALTFGFLISPYVGLLIVSILVFAIGDTLDGR
jgi:hypothetical protein